MLFAIHYTGHPNANTKADITALMTEFGKRGELAGTIGHYVYPGGGGFLIVDQEDLSVLYETVTAYGEWLEFDVRPVLTIDEAVPHIASYIGA
jgi:hypothetical protein